MTRSAPPGPSEAMTRAYFMSPASSHAAHAEAGQRLTRFDLLFAPLCRFAERPSSEPDLKSTKAMEYLQTKADWLRLFLLNEPRGGVFRHFNLLVPPKHPDADAGSGVAIRK